MRGTILRNIKEFFLNPSFKENRKKIIIDGISFEEKDVEIVNKYMYFDKKSKVYFFYDQCSRNELVES